MRYFTALPKKVISLPPTLKSAITCNCLRRLNFVIMVLHILHQASCRSLARLESMQDVQTTIYDVIRHVPETPGHTLLTVPSPTQAALRQ